MSYQIEIQNEGEHAIDEVRLCAAAAAVLAQETAAPDAAITIVIESDEAVAALNREFRGFDAPTDVLSFPADVPPVEIPDEPPYLGDLIIAYPYASAQAARERHNLGDSLALLVVHGTLHLLGYDHDTPERRAAMWAAQASALTALNIPLDIVPALESAPPHDEAEQDR